MRADPCGLREREGSTIGALTVSHSHVMNFLSRVSLMNLTRCELN